MIPILPALLVATAQLVLPDYNTSSSIIGLKIAKSLKFQKNAVKSQLLSTCNFGIHYTLNSYLRFDLSFSGLVITLAPPQLLFK